MYFTCLKRIAITGLMVFTLGACGSGGSSNKPPSTTTPPPSPPPNVVNNNSPPQLSGEPEIRGSVGQIYRFVPSASDTDGDILSFSIVNKPGWATFDTNTGLLTGRPGSDETGITTAIVISVSDGAATVSLSPFDLTVSDAGSGSVVLSWHAPDMNEDGSSLQDLAGYNIHFGTAADNLPNKMTVYDPSALSYTVVGLSAGVYYFTISAFDTSFNESIQSNLASKIIE